MDFEFATSARIVFGEGVARRLPEEARALGSRALVVTGRDPGRVESLLEGLRGAGLELVLFAADHEPDAGMVERAAAAARGAGCELVIGLGGGSALDTAKAAAALATNRRPLLDYLEVYGRGLPLEEPPLPWIAVPTTAGTGAEVTRNAVIALPEQRAKVSLRSPRMLAALVLADPELTCGLPPQVTAWCGLDALSQLVEAFLSRKANPLTDALCRTGLLRACWSLRQLRTQPGSRDARYEMSLASLMSGMALANAGLGAIHGIAGPLGGMIAAPHGAICAALLPAVTRINLYALQVRPRTGELRQRHRALAELLTENPRAHPEQAAKCLERLCREWKVPGLAKLGLKREQFPELVAKARQAGSMKGNPVELSEEELLMVLEESF